jgi:hypothetical protein
MRRKPLPKPFLFDIFVQQPCIGSIQAFVPQSSRAACYDGKPLPASPAPRKINGSGNSYQRKTSARLHHIRCTYASRHIATSPSASSVECIAYHKVKS